jgi:hypothetical protein
MAPFKVMPTSHRENVIARIRKLAALGASGETNEARLALIVRARLIRKYNIIDSELGTNQAVRDRRLPNQKSAHAADQPSAKAKHQTFDAVKLRLYKTQAHEIMRSQNIINAERLLNLVHTSGFPLLLEFQWLQLFSILSQKLPSRTHSIFEIESWLSRLLIGLGPDLTSHVLLLYGLHYKNIQRKDLAVEAFEQAAKVDASHGTVNPALQKLIAATQKELKRENHLRHELEIIVSRAYKPAQIRPDYTLYFAGAALLVFIALLLCLSL